MPTRTPPQPERYCLMHYRCSSCAHLEVIWNSRDAVTPFCVACGLPGCDGTKQHVDWQADRRWSELPPQASRVFVSITRRDARRLAYQKWHQAVDREDLPDPPEPKQETLAQWTGHIYGDGQRPYLIPRGDYLRRLQES